MTGKQVIKILQENGWRVDRINGSHHVMVKDGFGSVSVPVHGSKDLKKGTVYGILKNAGIK